MSPWACSKANIPSLLICPHVPVLIASLFLQFLCWSPGFSSHCSIHPHISLASLKHDFHHVTPSCWKPLWFFISIILTSVQYRAGFLLFSPNFSSDSLKSFTWSLHCPQTFHVHIFLCFPQLFCRIAARSMTSGPWCLSNLLKSWEHDKYSTSVIPN